MTVLAVRTPKRSALLSDVPTSAEAGYPNAEYLFWDGFSVRARTPRPVIDTLHDETEKALQGSSVREKLAKLGVDPELTIVAQFAKFVRDDIAATVQLGKDANMEPTD